MSVLVSLLAPSCQIQLTTVTRPQPTSRLISASLKAFLWDKLGASSHRETAFRGAMVQSERVFCWLSCSDSHINDVDTGMTVTRREAPDEKKHKQIWLAAPTSLGRIVTPVCKVPICTPLFIHTRILLYSVDCQHFHTLKFPNQSFYQTFCTVRNFHMFNKNTYLANRKYTKESPENLCYHHYSDTFNK